MKFKIIVILILIILLLAGCTNFSLLNSNIKNQTENHIINNTTIDSSKTEFTIYKIDSDTFENLLKNNSFENIKNVSEKYFNYPQDGDNYITYSNNIFEITNNFIELVNNKTFWEEYFAEDNADEKIKNLVIFETPYVPISVWMKTNINTYFLTLDSENMYNLYSQTDYVEQYKSYQFSLKINGEPTSSSKSIKKYYQNAELPLLEILSSFGAKIKWKNEDQVNISFNNENYLLDVNNNCLYNKHDKKNNILSACTGGGPYCMYFSDGEYYIDSDTLACVMLELGQKINIEYDMENKIINIFAE